MPEEVDQPNWLAAQSLCPLLFSVSSLKDDGSLEGSDSASEEAFDTMEQDGALTRFHGNHSNKARPAGMRADGG